MVSDQNHFDAVRKAVKYFDDTFQDLKLETVLHI